MHAIYTYIYLSRRPKQTARTNLLAMLRSALLILVTLPSQLGSQRFDSHETEEIRSVVDGPIVAR